MADELGQMLNKVTFGPDDGSNDVVLDESWARNSQKADGLCLLRKMIMKKSTNLFYEVCSL